MTSNVSQFPRSQPRTNKERSDATKKDGREAGRRMDRPNTKIPRNERMIIAKRLNDEIVQSGVKVGEFCEKAVYKNKNAKVFTYGTRELDKMRWRDGNKEDKELLAFSNRYLHVIAALATFSHQDERLLIDRITVGTSLHPLRADGELGEIEKTLRALEDAANKANQRLGLFDLFRETLQLKCEGLARGELDNWPRYPLDDEVIPRSSGEPGQPGEEKSKRAIWRARLEGTYEGFWGAFWGNEEDDVVSDGPDLDALCYLPHAYLGILADWHDWGVTGDLHYQREARRELSKEYDRIPSAVYAQGRLPEVVNTKEAGHGSPLSVHDFVHTWLILYPDRSMSTILPMLLTLDPTVGTVIERVTSRKLLELGRMELIERHPKAYDGVVALLAPPEGEKSLVEYWIETGQWFQQNPLLHAAARTAAARARRDKLFIQGDNDGQR